MVCWLFTVTVDAAWRTFLGEKHVATLLTEETGDSRFDPTFNDCPVADMVPADATVVANVEKEDAIVIELNANTAPRLQRADTVLQPQARSITMMLDIPNMALQYTPPVEARNGPRFTAQLVAVSQKSPRN